MPQRSDHRAHVTAPAGRVTGLRRHGVAVFRGIRYAEPPMGELRFSAPVDAAPVDQIDATTWGPASLQDPDPLTRSMPGSEHNFYTLDTTTSEDCLNLNIWAPEEPVPGGAPVLFWIHGGAFLYGSGTGAWTDGTRFARDHGIVVVTVNYRLGILGNLWLGDIDPTVSDLAIQDQISALRWVRRNIASFGGDPSRVTIAGQSAGGMSVAALLTAPGARGLFAGAMVESGHLAAASTVDHALEARRLTLAELAVDPDGDVIAQLRGLSSLRILQVQREFGISLRAFPLVADGLVLPIDLPGAVRAGSADGVRLLIGATAEEDRLFTLTGWNDEDATVRSSLASLLRDPDAVSTAEALYRDVAGSDRDRVYVINSEHGFVGPARALADAQADAGNPVFHYDFTRRSSALDGRVGAAHLSDLPVFWGNLDAPGVAELLGEEIHDEPVRRLAADLSGTIAQFVSTGSPDGGPLGRWPAYTAADRQTKIIDVESSVERDHLADRLDFWATHDAVAPLSTVGAEVVA